MAPSPYVRARSATAHIVLTALCALTGAGCGSGVGDNLFLYAPPADSCGGVLGRVQPATDVVLLDWSGGRSDLFDDLQLDPLDLSAFATLDGSTLAKDGEAFKDAVIAETATILCDIPGAAVHLTGSKVSLPSDFTTVHIAQVFSPTGGGQIGEGSFDPRRSQRRRRDFRRRATPSRRTLYVRRMGADVRQRDRSRDWPHAGLRSHSPPAP